MRQLFAGLLALLVSGCATGLHTTRSDTSGVPYMHCGDTLSKADQLSLGAISQRIADGNLYAALAQLQALPGANPAVATQRADVLRRLKNSEARAWYSRLWQDCELAAGVHGLGLLAAEQGDWAASTSQLKQAVSKAPADPRFRNDLGFAELMMGNTESAQFEFRTAAELNPQDRLPLFNLMLLALVKSDQVALAAWMDKLKPEAKERQALLVACGQVMRERLRIQMQLPSSAVRQPACPSQL